MNVEIKSPFFSAYGNVTAAAAAVITLIGSTSKSLINRTSIQHGFFSFFRFLVLELADGGDLYDYMLKNEKAMSEKTARHYFSQIVQAVDYCHQLHVVHRDLKPENVLMFRKLRMVKLTDFGFGHFYQPGTSLDTSCGSMRYSSPEILCGKLYDGPAVGEFRLSTLKTWLSLSGG